MARASHAFGDFLLDGLERGMPDILAVHHVDHVLADVLRVIADALERAHHPHDIERAADLPRIFHHERDALAVDRLVFVVDMTIGACGAQRRLDVEPRKGIERVMHHALHGAPQVADLAIAIRRPIHFGEPHRDEADLLALIPDALKISDRLDRGDDHAQIPGGRRARRKDAAAFLVDRDFHAVDLVVIARDAVTERAVPLDEGGQRLRELILEQPAHREDLRAHALEILVEAARGVMGKIGCVHGESRGCCDLTIAQLGVRHRAQVPAPRDAPAGSRR
jgi:hypothetical protein